jgi:hypothetical protein
VNFILVALLTESIRHKTGAEKDEFKAKDVLHGEGTTRRGVDIEGAATKVLSKLRFRLVLRWAKEGGFGLGFVKATSTVRYSSTD